MNRILKPYCQPAFLICMVVLASAGAGKTILTEWYDFYLKKSPLPIQRPMESFDEKTLAPFMAVHKFRIDNRDVLKTLGTEEYLQWEMEDPTRAENSPVRYCSLFVTYYELPDMVPHRPEECYVGGGNQLLSEEIVNLVIPKDERAVSDNSVKTTSPGSRTIDARYLMFTAKSNDLMGTTQQFSVLYLFNVNNSYAGGRTKARQILAENFFGKYSYFSKVEWKFYGRTAAGVIIPTKQETIEASERLLSLLLPHLEKNYWPDWKTANSTKDRQASSPSQ